MNPLNAPITRFHTRLSILLLLVAFPLAYGQNNNVKINEVLVDFEFEIITILGADFDFNKISDLEVTLGELGDITELCVSPNLPTSTEIVCNFPPGGLPAEGDFLLTVSTGTGDSKTAAYDFDDWCYGSAGITGGTRTDRTTRRARTSRTAG